MKVCLWLCFASILIPLAVQALDRPLEPMPIPREPSGHFDSHGFFAGGTETRVNLETIRLARHQDELTKTSFERWVIDFSSVGKRVIDAAAPQFQLRYFPSEKQLLGDGEDLVKKPARFVFLFQSIQDCFLSQIRLRQLARKSHFVKDIVLYPQIEKGDMALELDLKQDVAFEAHQPRSREGRLVLDLKNTETRLP